MARRYRYQLYSQKLYLLGLLMIPFFSVSPLMKLFGPVPQQNVFREALWVAVQPWMKSLAVPVGIFYVLPLTGAAILLWIEGIKGFQDLRGLWLSFVIFLGANLLSILVSFVFGTRISTDQLFNLGYLFFSVMVIWVTIRIINSTDLLVKALRWLVAATTIAVLYGIYVTVGWILGLDTGQIVNWIAPRLYGTAAEPQIFGNFLVSQIPILTVGILSNTPLFSISVDTVVWGLAILALAMTLAAGPWAAAIGSFVILIPIIIRIKWTRLIILFITSLIVVSSVLVIDKYYFPGYVNAYKAILVKFTGTIPKELQNIDSKPANPSITMSLKEGYQVSLGSAMERKSLRNAAWSMFLEHPLFGVGLGNYKRFYDIYKGSDSPKFPYGVKPHNQYLEIMAETGIIGFVAFINIVIQGMKLFIKNLHNGDLQLRSLRFGLMAALLGLAIHGYSFGIIVHNYVWVVFGLLIASCTIFNEQKSKGSTINEV